MQFDSLRQDLRYSLRGLRRDWGFFLAAILIVALGIAANTTIFSVVNTLLVRHLPFEGADRLVWIANTGTSGLSGVTSRVKTYQDWIRLNHTMEGLTAYFAFSDYSAYNLVGEGEPERLMGMSVAHDFLPFLGIRLELGRSFNADEAKWNGPGAILLTHGYWERRFGRDRNVVGRQLRMNDKPYTVIGVLPASFDFSAVFTPGARVDILTVFPITDETDRWGNTLAVIGRLKPGVSAQQAQADFDVVNEQIRRSDAGRWTFGAKLTPLQEYLTNRFRGSLYLLLCAVGAVLLVACANLSNLLLARSTARKREIAIRSALGASRGRLVRQMLTESLGLSLAGGLAGLGLSWAAMRYLVSIQGINIPLLRTAELDLTALGFTALAALLTGVLFGIVPALQLVSVREADSLKEGSRGTSDGVRHAWTRNALVISEVALACMLLAGAGLLIRSFLHVLDVNMGFQPSQVATWRIDTGARYSTDAQQAAYYDRLVRAAETVPGVQSAGITDALPLSRDRSWGAPAKGVTYAKGEFPIAHPRLVDWRYVRTMRIPLLAGRDFDEHDTATSPPVVLINQKMARRLFPGQNPLGHIVLVNGERKVVGVVGDVRHQSVEEEGGMEMYLPITQASMGSVELVVRTKVPPASIASGIRAALRGVEPDLPTVEYHELSELVDRAVSPRRFLVLLMGMFAGAAVLLAMIGIYGVISYSVTQRTQEIGIRMALGASVWRVQGDVMRQTLMLVSGGVGLGLVGAMILSRLISSLLFGMQPGDPLTFLATVGGLLLVAAFAGYLPALRASRVDPLKALRAE